MSGVPPTVSVVVPTLNEAPLIEGLLAHLRALAPLEIIVADGSSADGTAERASKLARVVRSEPNRGAQMNAGAREAKGDVLLFLHADARLGQGGLAAIREAMRDPAVAGGNFDIRYEGEDFVARALTLVNRARRWCGVFYGDSGIFCRRRVFEELGGYRPYPVLEDYEFARRMRGAGRLALLAEPVFVSSRRWRKSSLAGTLWAWFWIQALYLAGVSPRRLARMYRHVR